jgi:L-asparaginase II
VKQQPLVHVVRSGFVESVHHGTAVALDPSGAVMIAVGDPDAVFLPRSSNKPLQAAAMLRAGLQLDGALLALAAASHSGERYHLDGVRRMLASGGLTEAHLQNTADLPMDPVERQSWQRIGALPGPIVQNCSGKHAAMLLTCTENGWPVASYRDRVHPLQRHIAEAVSELAGEPIGAVAIDGCGAPVLGISLTGLARGFARLATAEPGTAEGRVAQAIRRHPEWLGGTGRPITGLLRAVPGLVAKDGAVAVFAAALPDGHAIAVKIADGSERAVLPVVVALLRRIGLDAFASDGAELDRLADIPVLGHGDPVGSLDVVGV